MNNLNADLQNPIFHNEVKARNPMFVREDDVARMLEGLRKAGLRE
ncbi:MAG: hypothetical protein O7I42_18270 [Alphaproteobacteria bacterium]|nr:hypothetical protein [Alphaproteobacteria bacterium]